MAAKELTQEGVKQVMTVECCVGVIYNSKGELLISQRHSDDSFGDAWEYPGGSREIGESREACVLREVLEEVGCVIKIDKFVMSLYQPYPNKNLDLHFL